MEHCSALKVKIMSHVIIWRKLEDIVLSEISQYEFSDEVPKSRDRKYSGEGLGVRK